MQFLRLFLTVFAACCMFVYEDTKEKDKEKGEVRNDKEIINESVSRSLELDELKKLWSEYCSIVDDLCDEFNLRVLNIELDTIMSELEEMKTCIKMNYDGPDGENSILLMRHCDNILDLKEPKLLTSLESLELLFQITFNEIDYSMKLQGTTKLFYDLKDEIEKYASYERSCKALAKLEDSILSKLESLDTKWDNIDLKERMEKSLYLERMILKRTRKYCIFIQRYDVLTHRQKILYEILLQEGLKNSSGGNTIYDVHHILRQKIQNSKNIVAQSSVPPNTERKFGLLSCIQRYWS